MWKKDFGGVKMSFLKLPKKFKNNKDKIKKNNFKDRKIKKGNLSDILNINKYINLLRNMEIRSRIIYFFAGVLFLVVLLTGILSVAISSNEVKSKISSYSTQIMEKVGINIESELGKVKSMDTSLLVSDEIQNNLTNYGDLTAYDKLTAVKDITQLINSNVGTSNFYNGIEIDAGGDRLNAIANISEEDVQKYIKSASSSDGSLVWDDSNVAKTGINVIGSLKSLKNQSVLGTLIISINESSVCSIYNNVNIGKNAEMFIVDGAGKVVSSKDKSTLGKPCSDKNLMALLNKNEKNINNIKDELKQSSRVYSLQTSKGKYLVCYKPLSGTNWYVIGKIPYSYLNSETNALRNSAIIIGIITILGALIIAILVSNSITNPLNDLIVMMKEAKEGNLTKRLSDKSSDEIGEVIRGFNEMIGKISNLITNVKDLSGTVAKGTEKIAQISGQSYEASELISTTMQDIAKGSLEQAQEVSKSVDNMNLLSEEINAVGSNIGGITNVISETSMLKDEAIKTVGVLKDKAIETSNASKKIVTEIIELNNSMKEIKEKVKLIVSIAEQTNLLSLNASIEAARVGEAGFTVVATEVKNLAEKSKEASVNINKIINDIQNKTQKTVDEANNTSQIIDLQMESVNQAENAFNTIFKEIENISKQIKNMEGSVNDIVNSKEYAVKSMGNISEVSEVNAATTQEISQNTGEQIEAVQKLSDFADMLNKLTIKLNTSIEMFKVE